MKNLIILAALLLALIVVTGCASNNTGNREFIPGKGWVPV